jgi:four helix bundle protein
MGEPIRSFTDLRVYQMACELDLEVFLETKSWPHEEKYSLVDQIRRSSRSIGANLAETWAKRRYPAHFVSKLTDADGELQETMHWLGRAAACGYLSPSKQAALVLLCQEVGKKLGKMMQNPESFC